MRGIYHARPGIASSQYPFLVTKHLRVHEKHALPHTDAARVAGNLR